MKNLRIRDGGDVTGNQAESMRGQINQFSGSNMYQLEIDWNQIELLGSSIPETKLDDHEDNTTRQKKLTEKGREYRKTVMCKKKISLVSRIKKKTVEIENMLHSSQNVTTVKEELAQLTDTFKMLTEVNDEMIEIDDEYSEDLWFKNIDEDVCAFKHKIYNWLKEVRGSKCGSSMRSSKSSKQASSKGSAKERAIQEKQHS